MGTKTGIEWTDATWNPIRGCTPVSSGCKNCYAAAVAKRFSGPGQPYEGLVRINAAGERTDDWNGQVHFIEKHLLDPLSWRKPKRVFVNSMSDLFHENVSDEQRNRIFAVMALCPHHTFQVLTKRPERMLAYMTEACTEEGGLRIGRAAAALFHGTSLRDRHLSLAEQAAVSNQFEWKELNHVWMGVSDEGNQHQRIDILRQVPAAVRFISAEPLIFDPGTVDLTGIDWVIVGGESGTGARPMEPDWARSLRDQCQAASVPFFFKQWGEWAPYDAYRDGDYTHKWFMYPDGRRLRYDMPNPDGLDMRDWTAIARPGKKAAGALLDGREWKQFPEVRQ